MSSLVEIPGGCDSLKYLLYPFHISYPLKLWSKYRWWKNGNLKRVILSLNNAKAWLTVIDRLGAPGDALITANVIRCIKKKYSNLKINCITPHPELVRLDPNIDSINQNETFIPSTPPIGNLSLARKSAIISSSTTCKDSA